MTVFSSIFILAPNHNFCINYAYDYYDHSRIVYTMDGTVLVPFQCLLSQFVRILQNIYICFVGAQLNIL